MRASDPVKLRECGPFDRKVRWSYSYDASPSLAVIEQHFAVENGCLYRAPGCTGIKVTICNLLSNRLWSPSEHMTGVYSRGRPQTITRLIDQITVRIKTYLTRIGRRVPGSECEREPAKSRTRSMCSNSRRAFQIPWPDSWRLTPAKGSYDCAARSAENLRHASS